MTDMTMQRGPAVGLDEIAQGLRDAGHIVVATHLNPDGDAIGSARAMELILQALGKDVLVYVPDAVVPPEYEFVRPDRLIDVTPEDIDARVVLCVDCGNESRVCNDEMLERARQVFNVDHHGDNTHFGDANHVRATASCAAQLVWELAGHLDVTIDSPIATAIYVGLVTDTGRFQYSNTTPESHELAASLMRSGADVHDIYRRIFERVPYARARLLGRALERSMRSSDGLIVATHLRQIDFVESGADEDDSEGIVDMLRSVEGTSVAVFLRDLAPGGEHLRKGSLRTTREDIDVSAIARTWNGGGHRQAAGFNTSDDLADVVERVRSAIRSQLGLD